MFNNNAVPVNNFEANLLKLIVKDVETSLIKI